MSDSIQTISYGQSQIKIDYNTGAHHAHGSVIVSRDGTSVIVCATFGPDPVNDELSQVPLQVNYLEPWQVKCGDKSCRSSQLSPDTQAARLIDRSIRPHLPAGLQHPLNLTVQVLASGSADIDALSIIGSSIAISRTGLDWSGPIAASAVEICQNYDFHINEKSINLAGRLMMSGSNNLATMAEFKGVELSEEVVSKALVQALEANNAFIEALNNNKETIEDANETILNINKLAAEHQPDPDKYAERLGTGYREDGRGSKELRELVIKPSYLGGAHGSAKLQQDETTVIAALTLDNPISPLEGRASAAVNDVKNTNRFIAECLINPNAADQMNQTNLASIKEHDSGSLLYQALVPALPDEGDYPYLIKLASQVISSDGSAGVASVAAGSLALYTAGVPVNSLCAGVNIGLAGSTDEPVLLTDITDSEKDHGQMRLAIAGTTKGINALQLDTKNNGVSLKNFTNALSNGKEARADIIEAMQTAVAGSAYNHPENAPLIVEIPREHIGRLIGKGGTNIRQIEDSTEAKITVENNQYAIIEGSKDAKNKVLEKIEAETRHYHVGEDFKATVREFLPYGAIVELEAGREALLHVSELRDAYVEKTEDLLKVGDEVPVTIVETSSDGRIKVSIREKYPEFFNDSATTPDQI